MKKEVRTVCFDEDLQIEVYQFQGMMQAFPNHFHEHYVIGFVEKGKRLASCQNKEFHVNPGDIVLFHPGENHSCRQVGEESLDYRALHISEVVMKRIAREVTGRDELPGFSTNVIYEEELSRELRELHQKIMDGSREFEKEEMLLFLIDSLITRYGKPFANVLPECREEIDLACRFLEEHYEQHISLEQMCDYAGLSKSTLLRAFTKSRGITPYRYLETVRINEAKKLLEQGCMPVEAALQTGFSDQSHFTNFFTKFIGISPGAYRDIFGRDGEKSGKLIG